MNKKYLLLVFIWIILYLLFLIVNHKYKEYNFNNYLSYLNEQNVSIKKEIDKKVETLEKIWTKAYKNKLLKETQNMKNKWEKVIFITKEDTFKTFTQIQIQDELEFKNLSFENEIITDHMTRNQKWFYFLFNKQLNSY